MKRERGFYWVLIRGMDRAIVAEWSGGEPAEAAWFCAGCDVPEIYDDVEVLSERIVPPSEQQPDNLYSLFKRVAAIAATMTVGSKVELMSDHAKLVVAPKKPKAKRKAAKP